MLFTQIMTLSAIYCSDQPVEPVEQENDPLPFASLTPEDQLLERDTIGGMTILQTQEKLSEEEEEGLKKNIELFKKVAENAIDSIKSDKNLEIITRNINDVHKNRNELMKLIKDLLKKISLKKGRHLDKNEIEIVKKKFNEIIHDTYYKDELYDNHFSFIKDCREKLPEFKDYLDRKECAKKLLNTKLTTDSEYKDQTVLKMLESKLYTKVREQRLNIVKEVYKNVDELKTQVHEHLKLLIDKGAHKDALEEGELDSAKNLISELKLKFEEIRKLIDTDISLGKEDVESSLPIPEIEEILKNDGDNLIKSLPPTTTSGTKIDYDHIREWIIKKYKEMDQVMVSNIVYDFDTADASLQEIKDSLKKAEDLVGLPTNPLGSTQ